MCGMYAVDGDARGAGRAARVRARSVHRPVAARHAGRVAREPESQLSRRGRAPARHGTAHPNIVPYQAFATADGHLMLAIGNDRAVRRFLRWPACRSSRPIRATRPTPAARASRKLVAQLSAVLSVCAAPRVAGTILARAGALRPINDSRRCSGTAGGASRLRIDLRTPPGTATGRVVKPVVFSRTALDYGRRHRHCSAPTPTRCCGRLGFGESTRRAARRAIIA